MQRPVAFFDDDRSGRRAASVDYLGPGTRPDGAPATSSRNNATSSDDATSSHTCSAPEAAADAFPPPLTLAFTFDDADQKSRYQTQLAGSADDKVGPLGLLFSFDRRITLWPPSPPYRIRPPRALTSPLSADGVDRNRSRNESRYLSRNESRYLSRNESRYRPLPLIEGRLVGLARVLRRRAAHNARSVSSVKGAIDRVRVSALPSPPPPPPSKVGSWAWRVSFDGGPPVAAKSSFHGRSSKECARQSYGCALPPSPLVLGMAPQRYVEEGGASRSGLPTFHGRSSKECARQSAGRSYGCAEDRSEHRGAAPPPFWKILPQFG